MTRHRALGSERADSALTAQLTLGAWFTHGIPDLLPCRWGQDQDKCSALLPKIWVSSFPLTFCPWLSSITWMTLKITARSISEHFTFFFLNCFGPFLWNKYYKTQLCTNFSPEDASLTWSVTVRSQFRVPSPSYSIANSKVPRPWECCF